MVVRSRINTASARTAKTTRRVKHHLPPTPCPRPMLNVSVQVGGPVPGIETSQRADQHDRLVIPPPVVASLTNKTRGYMRVGDRTAVPLLVPERLSFGFGRTCFDYSRTGIRNRIYIVPRGSGMLPEYQANPKYFAYSFTWSDWWRSFLTPEAFVAHGTWYLHEVWDRIMDYARNQQGAREPYLQNGPAERYLDFYRFVEPEIQVVEIGRTPPAEAFELRWADRGKYFYYNFLTK